MLPARLSTTVGGVSKIQTVTFVDDLDGRELDPQDAQTVSWSWLGVDYELDVADINERWGRVDGVLEEVGDVHSHGGKTRTRSRF